MGSTLSEKIIGKFIESLKDSKTVTKKDYLKLICDYLIINVNVHTNISSFSVEKSDMVSQVHHEACKGKDAKANDTTLNIEERTNHLAQIWRRV